MAFERIEPAAPELAVGSEPLVELGERLGAQPVPAPLTIRPHAHEPGLAKHPQMLRHARLAELEPLDELADVPLALAQQLQDVAPSRLGENGKGNTHDRTYYHSVIYRPLCGGLGAFPCETERKSAQPPRRYGTIGPMRRTTALTAVVIAGATAAAPATAQAAQRITANPRTVDATDTQTVRGRGWPVIEFCSRTIRVSVRSAQNSAPIAQRHIRANGRFAFRWIPQNKNIGPGNWRLVARMRCESGKDGSINFVTASARITIK
jgi:hypothetical protein